MKKHLKDCIISVAEVDLNEYLNTRLYNALPVQIKALVKQVEITTTVGEKSSNTSSSDCYITIPSIVDVNNDYNQPPYSAEKALSDPATISFMKDENSRKRAYPDGTYGNYWLRSPSVEGSATYYMLRLEFREFDEESDIFQHYTSTR